MESNQGLEDSAKNEGYNYSRVDFSLGLKIYF